VEGQNTAVSCLPPPEPSLSCRYEKLVNRRTLRAPYRSVRDDSSRPLEHRVAPRGRKVRSCVGRRRDIAGRCAVVVQHPHGDARLEHRPPVGERRVGRASCRGVRLSRPGDGRLTLSPGNQPPSGKARGCRRGVVCGSPASRCAPWTRWAAGCRCAPPSRAGGRCPGWPCHELAAGAAAPEPGADGVEEHVARTVSARRRLTGPKLRCRR